MLDAPATPLPDLIALRDALNRQITERQAADRAERVKEARQILAEMGLTPADLAPAGARPGRPKASGKAPIKYRAPGGHTWTGRGKLPVWLREALAAGANLDDFKVRT